MGEDSPSKVAHVLACEEGGVRGGVVKMNKSPSSDSAVGSAILTGDVKSGEDLSEEDLIHSVWMMDKFAVDEAPAVKECYCHAFPCSQCALGLLGEWFHRLQPLP